MGVPFDDHELIHLNRTRYAHPPDIVSAEVHEHDMLGPLLRICEKLFSERLVFLIRHTPLAGAGNRPQVDPVSLKPDHHLGRCAGDGRTPAAEEIHVGRRVDHPKRAVNLIGLNGYRSMEPLGRHDLEDISGPDILLGLAHGIFILRLCKIGRQDRGTFGFF